MFKKRCEDCGLPAAYHIKTWLDEIISALIPQFKLPKNFEYFFNIFLEKTFSLAGLMEMKDDFVFSEIQMRSACFIDAARKRGVKFRAAKGPFGYTNHFCAEIDGKKIRFESLPIAGHVGRYGVSFADCKERTRSHLKKGGFPAVEGKAFWFWRKGRAIKYGINKFGFPLVVKPRGGSVARHVVTNIRSEKELRRAIDRAIAYSPAFIVERFVENSSVFRATVVDFDYVAVVKQIPANVVGNGNSTIQELVDKKNDDQHRGESHRKEFALYKIVMDDTTKTLLAQKGYSLWTVPRRGEMVYLQKNPFLKLGGDLEEVTEKVHPDNVRLFKEVAKFFDIRLVGMDFLISDISRSWKSQNCAVLELNSLPCIEMHHFPSSGSPQNVADTLVDLFFKYYL